MGIGTKNCDTHILIEIYILQFIAEFFLFMLPLFEILSVIKGYISLSGIKKKRYTMQGNYTIYIVSLIQSNFSTFIVYIGMCHFVGYLTLNS